MALTVWGCWRQLQAAGTVSEKVVHLCTHSHTCWESHLTVPEWQKAINVADLVIWGKAGTAGCRRKVSWSLEAVARGERRVLIHR